MYCKIDFLFKELGSQPLPTIVTEDVDNHSSHSLQEQGHRPRAGN